MVAKRVVTRKPTKAGKPVKAKIKDVMPPRLKEKFFELIAEGKSVAEICRMPGMPCTYTIYKRIKEDKEFEEAYRLSREIQAEKFLDEIIAIADDGKNDTYVDGATGKLMTDHDVISRSRLRVDTRKWAMARMSPRKYSERVVQEMVGKDDGPIQVESKMTLDDFYNEFGSEPSKS